MDYILTSCLGWFSFDGGFNQWPHTCKYFCNFICLNSNQFSSDKINAFIDLMTPLGLVDACRTGVVAIARGTEPL